MIYIFLDEAGSFECNDGNKTKREIIGGVICKGIKDEGSIKTLSSSVEKQFITAGGYDYYNKIHGKQRNGKVQNAVLKSIFIDKKCGNKIIPFYIERGTINKKIFSNITDDNNASFLYLNMLNRVVSNLLLYKSGILNYDNKVIINLPTRVLPVKKLSTQEIKAFKELSYDILNGKVVLDLSPNLLSALSCEISNCSFLKNKIYVEINANKIAYGDECDNKGNLNVFYQLSDFVCNNAYLKVMDDLNEIVFAYDDIDECYRKIIQYYNEKKLYEYINQKEKYNIEFKNSKYKRIYDSYIKSLDEEKLYNDVSIKDFIIKEGEEIKSKEYNRIFVKKKLDKVDEYITSSTAKNDLKTAIEYYIFKMRTYNHLGNFKENSIIYKQNIMKLTYNADSLDIIRLRMEAINLYAVTLSNSFLFKESIAYIDKLIKYQEFVEEMYKEIACDMDKKEIRKNYVDINMGKYLSSKGQYMSFINEASAEKYFLEALGCFKYNDKQKNQAISYLIHYYSYFEIVPENNIRQIIDKYFGFDSFQNGINYFTKIKYENLLSPGESFKLFAFIKYWVIYEEIGQDIGLDQIERLGNKLVNLCSYVKKYSKFFEHPYELIFYNIAQRLETASLKKEFNDKAISICKNPNSEFTLKVIGFMIKLNCYKNKKDLGKFIKFLNEEDILDDTRKYFEVNALSREDDINKALNIINSKFTYMYR
ncbi:hypothetical protein [Clostridium sp. BJN0013]|mgnify:CR=1 FL=1|uniref:hypothetical protein n=1 Tax=Clostridium sp. BJN0013 TaxID=3236840 RepID=UPI0034C640B8